MADVRSATTAKPDRRERGFALPITLLTLLLMTAFGVAFAILGDTENRISLGARDDQQVLYIAEAGTRVVISWFNQPDPLRNPLVPLASEMSRDLRVGDSDYDGVDDIDVPTNGSVDYYRGGSIAGSTRLFSSPYHKYLYCTFWGSEENPEILIVDDPEDAGDYLSRLNATFNATGRPSLGRVRIVEIRVYGPPMDADLAARYGIASAMVRAVKEHRTPAGEWRVVARRTLRIVLNELPYPPPMGAIETAGNIDAQGNFAVHWGGSFAEGDLDTQQGANFPGPAVPRQDTSAHSWEDFSPNAPDLDLGAAGTQNLLEQLLQEPYPIPDPWLLFRADVRIKDAPNENDQPWPYQYDIGAEDDRSFFFQNQTYVFPRVDYEIWKEIAQSGYKSVHYFSYAGVTPDGEALFKERGIGDAKRAQQWVNTTRADVEPGIFFFDTKNSMNPQWGGPGILTDPVKLDAAKLTTGAFLMEGFFFFNASRIDSSGISGKTVDKTVNMPSEPFLDVGIDLDGSTTVDPDEIAETAGNGIWDFDLDGDGTSDGDRWSEVWGTSAFTAFEEAHRFADGEFPHAVSGGAPPGVSPTTHATIVHEPFLNLRYPDKPDFRDPIPVDYDAEVLYPRETGGDRDDDGVKDRMTSLRDPDGALVTLPLNIHGIFYNEGWYFGEGNMSVFGSMLFRQGFAATGTPDVWFDEALRKGAWPPLEMDIPRVYVTQLDTGH